MNFPEFLLQEKQELPPLRTFIARDKDSLSYRIYESARQEKVVICLHGSASHGEYLNDLARNLADAIGICIVPNLRGHFASGKKRGDCKYIGQLEDDLMDLIQSLHLRDKKIYLLGHSSGGGLAIRLAGSEYREWFEGYILIAPAIPTARTMKKRAGWADVSFVKIAFMSVLNKFGITSFNHSSVIRFNMPKNFRNGSETLSYTFNLNTSYHPRMPYENDIDGLGNKYLCIVGENDELMEPQEYKKVMHENNVRILSGIGHLDIVINRSVMQIISEFIMNVTGGSYGR